MSNFHGRQPLSADAIFTDGTGLPNATTAQSTAVYLSNISGQVSICMYANTIVSIATDKLFSVEITKSSDGNTYVPLFDAEAHFYPIHKTSADGILAYAAGELMFEFVLPKTLTAGYPYYQLEYITDANESSELVDAFMAINA